ncbi:hypothetical protein [Luteirhabdus pelagi]|uniref:hypothetical protein n=1 Tax=Luteirhabdus pelagi TaxID=2792783 RepID=UPI00193A1822|nr:hypothetical protein [Luteirhabdus pelagi]
MNKIITVFFVLCISPYLYAQVGIGTTNPNSMLDIPASNPASPTITDGILIPRLDAFPDTDPGAAQDGMMIFLNSPVGTDDRGFYYWDHSVFRWRSIGAEEWKDGVNGSGDDYVYATQARLSGTDVVVTDDGRIGFGTDDPIERFEFKGPGDNDLQITSANTNPPNFILYNTGGTLAAPALLGTNQEVGSLVIKTHDGAGVREIGGFRFYMDGTPTTGSLPSRFTISNTPNGSTSQVERLIIRENGNTGLSESNPTATLHLRRGTASANSAPLKFTAGTRLTTPEAGAMEYDGTELYFTPGSMRQVVMRGLKGSTSIDFPSIPINSASDQNITVSGAALGDSCNCSPQGAIETGVSWNCFVSAANTVTIRVSNVRNASINPAPRTWNVTVFK